MKPTIFTYDRLAFGVFQTAIGIFRHTEKTVKRVDATKRVREQFISFDPVRFSVLREEPVCADDTLINISAQIDNILRQQEHGRFRKLLRIGESMYNQFSRRVDKLRFAVFPLVFSHA